MAKYQVEAQIVVDAPDMDAAWWRVHELLTYRKIGLDCDWALLEDSVSDYEEMS
jgi:hypothetical protein